ncbi:RagB/SusD family nutrient uptake outer membrane protein, partial [Parapusillimonas sp. SGNA-6]|nr:RagB/SusD family nutrient uptake outer membrane protein [Parapusillimonas sp. SGNA-6]
MKRYFKVIIMGLLMLGASCNSFLDMHPEDFLTPNQYFETAEQVNYALNGVYTTLGATALYGGHILGRYGLDADLGFSRWGNDIASVGDYNVVPTDVRILNYWETLYAGINRANLLLENIGEANIDEHLKSTIIGEALFLRAYFYFMLTIRFGDVPLILHTAQAPSAEALQIPAAKSKEIYDKVLLDMEEASLLVRDVTDIAGGGRISKSTVWGIMARVCLYMAGNPLNETSKYEDARKWAKMVIDEEHHELNPSFQQVFMNYIRDIYDTTESIWEVEFWGDGVGLYGGASGLVGIHNGIATTDDPEYGWSRGILCTTDFFYRLFETGDLRRDWTIAPYGFSGTPATINYWATNRIYDRY